MTKSLSSLIKEARRALDQPDPDAALRHCRTALKLPDGANNVKVLLLTAQACQALDPPRLDDAIRALGKAVEIEPDSIQAWGLMRNVLRRAPPSSERPVSLKQAYEKLISLCENDPESQHRLKKELIDILESGQDERSKRDALEIRLQMTPFSDQDLVEIMTRQLQLKVDCFTSLRELIERGALPDSLVEEAVSIIFTTTIGSSSEEVWSERLSLLFSFSDSSLCKSVLQHLVSMALVYRRIFNCEKSFFRRICCSFLRLIPNDYFAWAALSCLSVPPLSNAPEDLDQVRAAIRIGELSTSKVPFPKDELLPLSVIIAESYDAIIGLQLELQPFDLVSMKVRLRSCSDLIEGILKKCPELVAWKEAMKTSLRISACLFRTASESAQYLETRYNLHPRAQRALINSLMECGKFSTAAEFIEQFWPNDRPAWVLSALSWCHFMTSDSKQPDSFLCDARTAVTQSPHCALYHARIGQMYFALDHDSVSNKRRALESFMTAARLDPLSSYPWTNLGRYYRKHKNDTVRALKCYRKAISLNAIDSEAGIALCELLPPSSDEIVTVCKAAIDTASFFCEWPWRYLLQAHLQRQEWLDCVGAIQNLLKASPNDIHLWTQLGFVYLRMGKFQASARAYSQAVKIDDNNIRAHYSLADVYLRMDQPADAISQLEHTLSLNMGGLRPAIVELLRQTYFEHGKQLAQSGAAEDSQQHFDKALNLPVLESSLLETWKLVGDIQMSRSEPLLAAKAYTRAIFRSPSQPEAWYDLGIAFFKVRSLQLASHCLRTAIILRPEYADAWVALTFTIPLNNFRLRSFILSHAVKCSGHRNAPAWTAFALLALQYGDIDAAQKAVVEAQRSDPVFEHLPAAQGLIFRASVAVRNGS